jgi:hypothetical protein
MLLHKKDLPIPELVQSVSASLLYERVQIWLEHFSLSPSRRLPGRVTSSTPKRVRGMQGQKASAGVEFGSASGVASSPSYQLSLDLHLVMT